MFESKFENFLFRAVITGGTLLVWVTLIFGVVSIFSRPCKGQDLVGAGSVLTRDPDGTIHSKGLLFSAWMTGASPQGAATPAGGSPAPRNFYYTATQQGEAGSQSQATAGMGRLIYDQSGWSIALLGDAGAAFQGSSATLGTFRGGFTVIRALPAPFLKRLGLPPGVGIFESVMVTKSATQPRVWEYIIGLSWRKGR